MCCMPVIEAVARNEKLRKVVQVHICTSSWPHDEWEEHLERYLEQIEGTGMIERGSVDVHSMKFHREHNQICANLRKHLEGKHFVVQCEQGADFFVGPLSGQWLQDNYEDNFVHLVCMHATQAAGTPVYLLQTQTELDLERGVPKKELDDNVFGGGLLMCLAWPSRCVLMPRIKGTRSLAASPLTQQLVLLLTLNPFRAFRWTSCYTSP